MNFPRILVAGLRGSSGKTLIALGVIAAWTERGYRVAPYKKGPDYIDAAWLSVAGKTACRNLDLFMMSPQAIVRSFATSARGADLAVIEGNRGLFDGLDAQGSCSTAELAKVLQSPVVLAVDCTKSIRTVAATILGCQRLDPQVPIQAVILNQVAGPRHESVVREAVAEVCGLPVLGAIPRLRDHLFPERHMGLVPPQEHDQVPRAVRQAADMARQYLDLDALERLAQQAPAFDPAAIATPANASADTPALARIGVFRDAAFQFYYPENLEALVRQGARLVEISPLGDAQLPEVDALYIGGGFPETAGLAVAENQPFLHSVRRAVEQGLPIYAECGGAVFLGDSLVVEDRRYPMAGILPVDFAFGAKRLGHGYTELETVEDNPFFPVGTTLRGHEFHYTYMQPSPRKDLKFAFRVRRGYAFDGQRDGLSQGNVLACYTHVHALGVESWAPALVQAAVKFKSRAAEPQQVS